MSVPIARIISTAIPFLFSLAVLSGCAEQKYAVKDTVKADFADVTRIQSLTVSDDASQVIIVADKPLVYTYYKTSDPPRVLIDLSQTDPGAFTKPIDVNNGNLKKIEVTKHEYSGGFFSRVEVVLGQDGDFSVTADPNDKRSLQIVFAPVAKIAPTGSATQGEVTPKSVEAQQKAEVSPGKEQDIKTEEVKPVEVAGSETLAEAKTAGSEKPVVKAASKDKETEESNATEAPRQRVVTGLNVGKDGVDIVVEGGVDGYNAFSLSKPNRLIVDVNAAKSGISASSVPVNGFGISKARIGVAGDKVRIVFDAPNEFVKPYRVTKTATGLQVLFGAAAAAEKSSAPAGEGAGQEAAPEKQANAAGAKPGEKSDEKSAGKKGLVAVEIVKDGIELVIPGGMDRYANFRMSNPERLIVDVFGAKNHIAAKTIEINSFGLEKARLGTTADKVRIVFDASKGALPAYQVVRSENGLKIAFSGSEAAPRTAASVVSDPSPGTNVSGKTKARPGGVATVESIDFQVMDGFSRIAVRVTGECGVGTPGKVRDGLSLTLKKCRLPKKLQRMLDTGSFASVVRTVTPYAVRTKGGEDTRILVKLRASAPFTVKQEDGLVYWDIKNTEVPEPKKSAAVAAKSQADTEGVNRAGEPDLLAKIEEPAAAKPAPGKNTDEFKKVYTGRKVTLEFSDADIRKIFQLIAEVSNLNFLIADDVTGTISLKLVNVPWDQALDVILESKGLEMKREGNIVQIKPRGKFKSMAEADMEARRVREKQMDLHTVVFEINYASVSDIAGQLEKLKSLHDNVSVSVDARTNRVIVTDIQPSIDKMRELIKTLDMPEKQVMIEARIVEATTEFARDMGVQWTLDYTDGSASILGINALSTSLGGIVSNSLPSGNVGGMSTGVSFGRLMNNIQLDLRLSAAATSGLVKIISTPKVVTLNNKAAKISQGQSIPYQSTSAEGTKTEFVEAALTLEVTPHITADGNIAMKIKASNNSPGTGTPPPINKKEATTELAVRNGETTVIGGIYVDSDTETDTGVPFLKDIPLFGWLFKSNAKSKSKSELLIFITPKIVS